MDLYADLKGTHNDSHVASTNSVKNMTSINMLNDLGDVSETAIYQSAIFIEDGIRYRSIHHRIDSMSLKLYRIYYSRYVRWFLGFVIFINLMLAFIEFPTSLTLSSDSRFRKSAWHTSELQCGITESIELLCLLVFLVDCSLKFYLIGWRRFLHKPWLILYVVMIVISFVDMGVSLAFCNSRHTIMIVNGSIPYSLLPYTLRIRRYCRPLFFLLSSTIMKKFAKAVVLTLPQIFSVLVLLLLHLYVFAMIGLLVFPRPIGSHNVTNSSDEQMTEQNSSHTYSYYVELEGSHHFNSSADAFVTLLVLLTTANHPDVMMQIYQYNRFSAIYFILFVGIGSFLILNLLIATTYNQFKGFFQKSLQSSFFRRRVAFRAAFTILARKTYQLQKRRGYRLSYDHEVASKTLIRQLLQMARIPKKQLPQMHTKLEIMSTESLNWQEFREVFDLVSKEPTKKKNRDRVLYYGKYRWFQWVQLLIRHKYFSYFTYAVSIINVLLITLELQISYNTALQRSDSRLAYYNLAFVAYYILEQVLKLIGLGLRRYFRSFGNIYEGGITIILVLLETILLFTKRLSDNSTFHFDAVIRLMNIFIVFRLLRILAHVKSLRILISIIVDLFRNLSGFLGLMVVIYYIFALLGMELFIDVDGASLKKENEGNWSDVCGTYDNLIYYANNFHDFASSLVTLWDVMVVNNWFVFLDKFARDSVMEGWSKLYFIIWWLTAAIMGMNLFVSLVLDTFLIKWEAAYANRTEDEVSDKEEFVESDNWQATSNSTENMV